jgi:hypothetical protein
MTGAELRDVEELCRLALAARRLECTLHLTGAGPDLRALIRLAGVGDVLRECPATRSRASIGHDQLDLR